MLVEFEQNRMVQTTRNFELFDKKKQNKKTKQNKKRKQKTNKQNKTKTKTKKQVFYNHFW